MKSTLRLVTVVVAVMASALGQEERGRGGVAACYVTQTGCSYAITMKQHADCDRMSTGNRSSMSVNEFATTGKDEHVVMKLNAMQEKLSRMIKELSVRTLRHIRQIKTSLQKLSATMKDGAVPSVSGSTSTTAIPGGLSAHQAGLQQCLPEFVRVGAWPSCYRFSVFNATWHESREYCSAFGANLLALDSLKEAHIIDYLLNSKPEYQERDSWWTSGNYMVRNQRWMWTSKHHLKPVTYSRWIPTNYTTDTSSNTSSGLKHCLTLLQSARYYWQEANCIEKHYFICEMDDTM